MNTFMSISLDEQEPLLVTLANGEDQVVGQFLPGAQAALGLMRVHRVIWDEKSDAYDLVPWPAHGDDSKVVVIPAHNIGAWSLPSPKLLATYRRVCGLD
ncbi:MAG TPA: hypothetical protein VK196_02805 [Magnetospirillum sp.]|nr:hypothetical protein [Magnetospirillum sp.]